jgi:hypothetical protein
MTQHTNSLRSAQEVASSRSPLQAEVPMQTTTSSTSARMSGLPFPPLPLKNLNLMTTSFPELNWKSIASHTRHRPSYYTHSPHGITCPSFRRSSPLARSRKRNLSDKRGLVVFGFQFTALQFTAQLSFVVSDVRVSKRVKLSL